MSCFYFPKFSYMFRCILLWYFWPKKNRLSILGDYWFISWGVRPKSGGCYFGSHKGIPLYTPYRSRKHTFPDHQKIFTWLENAFVCTGRSWKPHKRKEHIFLHRNYIPKNFSTPKKKLKISSSKKIGKKSTKKCSGKFS